MHYLEAWTLRAGAQRRSCERADLISDGQLVTFGSDHVKKSAEECQRECAWAYASGEMPLWGQLKMRLSGMNPSLSGHQLQNESDPEGGAEELCATRRSASLRESKQGKRSTVGLMRTGAGDFGRG